MEPNKYLTKAVSAACLSSANAQLQTQSQMLTPLCEDARSVCVLDTDFGAGLLCLHTLAAWQKQAPHSAKLHYMALANMELTEQTFSQQQQAWLCQQSFADETEQALYAAISTALQAGYPWQMPGWHQVHLLAGRVSLSLYFGEPLVALSDLSAQVSVWALQGELAHTAAMALQMARLSSTGAQFFGQTLAPELIQALHQAGFSVQAVPEDNCVCGQQQAVRPFSSKQPWFEPALKMAQVKTALVVGAGLAGASVALALAKAGVKVQVLEQHATPAMEASSNLAGAIHPLITADWNLRSAFYLRGFEHTLQWLSSWLADGTVVGELNGLLQLSVTDVITERVNKAFDTIAMPPEFARKVTAAQASELLGQTTPYAGVYFPKGGWVQPASVIAACLKHENITLHLNQTVQTFERIETAENGAKNHQAWWVQTQNSRFEADILVLATGALSATLNEQLQLPIRPVKGQTSYWPDARTTQLLNTTVTHLGYSANCAGGLLSGATFEAPDMSISASEKAHLENWTMLQAALPALPNLMTMAEGLPKANVAFRPTVPDHLPLVGALPDFDWMAQAYLSQSHSHVAYRYAPQRYQAGLFVSNGHGARGLMSAFLAADLICQQALGGMGGLPNSLSYAIHPARHTIRQWRCAKSS